MADTKPRYSLSYVMSVRKFCVYDRVMDKQTNGSNSLSNTETMVNVLNVAEEAFKRSEAERRAL